MKITSIIVDDEPVSQDLLKRYIADAPQLYLAGVCSNAFEAHELLLEKQVQLMFLDINMPKISGMSFLKSLKNPPMVIFTTAYPEYALEGYDVDAVDYLLKPFSFERFVKAVNKASERLKLSEQPVGQDDFVMLRADKKIFKIQKSEITHLEAMGDYVKVFYGSACILVHDTLQHLLEEIDSVDLIRVHRSWAVSGKYISFVEGNAVTIGNREIPLGQRYRDAFLKHISAR